eukprot:scaffold27131_cov107-Isochrysis_galbana.AAC.1
MRIRTSSRPRSRRAQLQHHSSPSAPVSRVRRRVNSNWGHGASGGEGGTGGACGGGCGVRRSGCGGVGGCGRGKAGVGGDGDGAGLGGNAGGLGTRCPQPNTVGARDAASRAVDGEGSRVEALGERAGIVSQAIRLSRQLIRVGDVHELVAVTSADGAVDARTSYGILRLRALGAR